MYEMRQKQENKKEQRCMRLPHGGLAIFDAVKFFPAHRPATANRQVQGVEHAPMANGLKSKRMQNFKARHDADNEESRQDQDNEDADGYSL